MAVGFSNTSNQIPDWLQPYVTGYDPVKQAQVDPNGGLIGKAFGLSTTQAPLYDTTKQNAINSVGNRIAGLSDLQTNAMTNLGTMKQSDYLNQGANLINKAGAGTYNAATAQQYMNPYMQMVVDQQKKSAIQDYQRQMPTLQAGAFQAGAGRGTRSALMQSEANRNLQNNLQNIQAQGLQNAWQQGQGQFNTEAARQLSAGQGLGQFAQSDYDQAMGILNARMSAGQQKQQLEQNQLDTAYENYLAQQREPYQQLGFMSDILQGIPANAYTSQMYTPSARPDITGQRSAALTQGIGYLGSMG